VSVRPADALVAAVGNEPVGFVRLHFDDEPAHRQVTEVWGLSVAPGLVRQGIGMLAAVCMNGSASLLRVCSTASIEVVTMADPWTTS
jgi:hypothetical protein